MTSAATFGRSIFLSWFNSSFKASRPVGVIRFLTSNLYSLPAAERPDFQERNPHTPDPEPVLVPLRPIRSVFPVMNRTAGRSPDPSIASAMASLVDDSDVQHELGYGNHPDQAWDIVIIIGRIRRQRAEQNLIFALPPVWTDGTWTQGRGTYPPGDQRVGGVLAGRQITGCAPRL